MINPPPLQIPISSPQGGITPAWASWFSQLRTLFAGVEDSDAARSPDAYVALASVTAALATALQELQTQPPTPTTELYALENELRTQPRAPTAELEVALRAVEQSLATQPRQELGTFAALQQNNLPWVTFDTTPQAAPSDVGTLFWSDTDQTLDLAMEYSVIQKIGQTVYARVENATGVTINKGEVVGFVGVSSQNVLSVAPYLADGSAPSLYILGVMAHDLPNSGEIGYAQIWGHISNIDTSAFSVGDILYASPTVAGGLTNVKPTAPDNVIPVAAVLEDDATTGEIFVRPTIEQEQYYGEFTKTGASTSPASANVAYAVTWDNTEIANGVSLVSGSQITVVDSGLYQFDVTLQLQSNSGVDKNVIFWFKKNGTNIANTARIVTVTTNAAYAPIALSEFFSLDAGDYVELWWLASSTNVALVTVAAGGTAPNNYPAAPAGIVAVNQIQL